MAGADKLLRLYRRYCIFCWFIIVFSAYLVLAYNDEYVKNYFANHFNNYISYKSLLWVFSLGSIHPVIYVFCIMYILYSLVYMARHKVRLGYDKVGYNVIVWAVVFLMYAIIVFFNTLAGYTLYFNVIEPNANILTLLLAIIVLYAIPVAYAILVRALYIYYKTVKQAQ